jgi:protein-L-isoaspartate(D-aspartate) O-methyltransferase
MTDYTAARLHMVEGQLRPNRVNNVAVLDAFLTVPREEFVPAALRGSAYVDDDLPLGAGRRLMEPMVLARLLQLAAPGKTDKALEIGCGSGYGAALLAQLAGQVTALECDRDFAAAARARLGALGCTKARVVEGPLAQGWRPDAPYDVILISGAAAAVPPGLAEQLAEGGRLVGVVLAPDGGIATGPGKAFLMTRAEGVLSSRPIFDAGAALLPGMGPAPSFVF